jgi:phage pi2 protein 07
MRAILLLLLLASPAVAQTPPAQTADPEKTAAEMINPAAQRATDQALKWLASRQNGDGSFGLGTQRNNAAICGLSGMAFMAGGSTPGRGPDGARVAKAIDYVLSCSQPSGFICEEPCTTQGPMYSHGFATLFLSECYGMSKRPDLRDKLSRSVKLIVDCQNKEGGWRYYPKKDDADLSVTACQVMALRAAHNAGMNVPQKTIEDAVKYVKSCRNRDGGFLYMPNSDRETFSLTAAAVVALNSAGIYQPPEGKAVKEVNEGKEVAGGLDYLTRFRPEKGVTRRDEYFEYGHYYAVQAMWLAGGERWARWYPAIRDELISRQGRDGSWDSTYGSEYATAMCLIILQMPENHLPIFQR